MAKQIIYGEDSRQAILRELFGKGSVEGLMAAETGDNAAVPGALIPALALGIMHVVFAEEMEDRDYLAQHTLGAEQLRERVRESDGAAKGSKDESASDRE